MTKIAIIGHCLSGKSEALSILKENHKAIDIMCVDSANLNDIIEAERGFKITNPYKRSLLDDSVDYVKLNLQSKGSKYHK